MTDDESQGLDNYQKQLLNNMKGTPYSENEIFTQRAFVFSTVAGPLTPYLCIDPQHISRQSHCVAQAGLKSVTV